MRAVSIFQNRSEQQFIKRGDAKFRIVVSGYTMIEVAHQHLHMDLSCDASVRDGMCRIHLQLGGKGSSKNGTYKSFAISGGGDQGRKCKCKL